MEKLSHNVEFLYFEIDELTRGNRHDPFKAVATIDEKGNIKELDKVKALRNAGVAVIREKCEKTGRDCYKIGAGMFESEKQFFESIEESKQEQTQPEPQEQVSFVDMCAIAAKGL